MGRFWVLALFGSLPGCFSPAVTVASLAADGVSYAASGKTVADRGLSVVTARDCELLLRIVDGRPVCVDRPVEEGVPVEDRRRPHYFLVVGSFVEPMNAAREAARLARHNAVVVPATVDGRLFHRVVLGPLSATDAIALAPSAWRQP